MTANKGSFFAAVAIVLLAAPVVHAQGQTDQTLAQSLFDEAVRLMDQGHFAEACPKLAESQHLDPGGGTLLNLGFCREKEGKLASAWAAYDEALSQAIKDGRKDRENTARVHVQQLESKLSRLSIDVSDPARATEGIEIRLDGVPVRQAAWGVLTPIDRGEHGIVVTAPGKREYRSSLTVESDGGVEHVAIPALANAPPDERRAHDGPGSAGSEHRGPSTQALIGWITGGVGVALVGVGIAGGVLAIDAHNQSNQNCPNNHCTQVGVDDEDRAKTFAWLSDVGVGLGAAAMVTGLVLALTAPRASAHVVPVVSAHGAGAALTIRF